MAIRPLPAGRMQRRMPIRESSRQRGNTCCRDLSDAHAHLGTPNHAYAGALTDPEYVLKLWLAHGITTVRDVGAVMGLKWTLEHKALSERNEIAAPRMAVHAVFPGQLESPAAAREWVQSVHRTGATASSSWGRRRN